MKTNIKDLLYKIFVKFQALFFILLGVDILTKILAVNNLSDGTIIRIFGLDWLRFELTINDGVAFSLLRNLPSAILAIFSIFAFVAIEYYLIFKKPKEKIFAMLLVIIAAGALGNGIDRLAASFGKTYILEGKEFSGVVDFINVTWFANFNVADIYVTLGIIALVIYLFFAKDEDEKAMAEAKANIKENNDKEVLEENNIESTDKTNVEAENTTIKEENKEE